MLDRINAALREAAQRFADRRTDVCQVTVVELARERCALAGSALDQGTVDALVAALRERLPEIGFDVSAVQVLRRAEPVYCRVATNLMGVYAEPSFLAEQLSQLLAGERLEILREQDRWCFARQDDGYLAWAYRPYLGSCTSTVLTHVVCAPISLLRAAPDPTAGLVTRMLGGTMVAVGEIDPAPIPLAARAGGPCNGGWRRLMLPAGATGWASASDLRDLAQLPDHEASRRAQIIADAWHFVGVPYLWGGCSALGIDCSGFAQLLYRLAGVILPRDADMQYFAGHPVEFPYQPSDLLFFGEPASDAAAGPKITHVGISLGGWRIIHSSRSRNGVYEDDVQAVPHLRESFVGARTWVTG